PRTGHGEYRDRARRRHRATRQHLLRGVDNADRQEVDARPSDAITLALYAGAPVFVTSEMLDLSVVVSAPDARHAREIRHERSRVEQGHPADMSATRFRNGRRNFCCVY